MKPASKLFALFTFIFLPTFVHAFDTHQPFDISSDILEYDDASQDITATGHVVVVQGSSTLHADLVRYDRQGQHLIARGNVIAREKGGILMGDQMDYDLALEKGIVMGGKGYGSPWLFQGAAWEKNKDYYIGRNASFTSCELIDPHYHIKASRVHVIPDRLFWAWNNVFYLDKNPVFYSPFLYKSLGPRRVVFQAQPGNDTVKGAFAKTKTTIRLVDGIYDKVLVDYYSISGTGIGNEFNYQRPDYKGSVFGYYINPKGDAELVGAPNTPQYNIRFYHWQQLSETLTYQSNINHRKNVSFNNAFFSQDPNQSVTDVNNSMAFTHQTRRSNQRLVMEALQAPDDNADPLFGETHIQSSSLPRYEFTVYQIPLWSPQKSTSTLYQMPSSNPFGPIALSVNGGAENYYSRVDDQSRLKANAAGTIGVPIRLSRDWSLSPSVTPSIKWQDKYDPFVPTTSTETATIPSGIFRGYQGRFGTSTNLRYRPFSSLTLDENYALVARMAPNEFALDRSLQDGGIETNHLNAIIVWRPSRIMLLRSFSGYDLRQLADEPEESYEQRRVDPWTNELTIDPRNSTWSYFYRYQLGYYPTRTLSWGADIRGHFIHKTYLQSGLSYNISQRGLLTWNNKAGLYLSSAWRVEFVLNSQFPNNSLVSLRDGKLLQSEFIVTRQIHCWDIQFLYKDLPPFTKEYSFLFNVRLGGAAAKAKQIADPDLESQFYPWRAEK